ncbi:MAG: hypothetical protein E6G96_15795 [Alphaproteobacteria bacterium]|nr:MAG: hypothetical protein E6G96_15795 [Alphaproteobacteria bacterium]
MGFDRPGEIVEMALDVANAHCQSVALGGKSAYALDQRRHNGCGIGITGPDRNLLALYAGVGTAKRKQQAARSSLGKSRGGGQRERKTG